MLKISAVYLIGKAEIPIHYTTWSQVEQALLIKPNVMTLFDPCQTFWMGVCVPLWFQNTFQNFQSVADSISRKLSHKIPKRWKLLSQFKKALTPLYNLQFTLVQVKVWTVVYYQTIGSGQSIHKNTVLSKNSQFLNPPTRSSVSG